MAKNNDIDFCLSQKYKTIQCEKCGLEFLLFIVLRGKDEGCGCNNDQILGPVLTWDSCPGCTKPLGDPEHMTKDKSEDKTS